MVCKHALWVIFKLNIWVDSFVMVKALDFFYWCMDTFPGMCKFTLSLGPQFLSFIRIVSLG